jgi:hypothetical protein
MPVGCDFGSSAQYFPLRLEKHRKLHLELVASVKQISHLWTGKSLKINTPNNNITFGRNPNQEYHTFKHTDGQNIQYTAYKLPDGTINVGRIHGVE